MATTAPDQRNNQPGSGLVSLVLERLKAIPELFLGTISELIPTGLYARTLLIIITPIVLFEGILAYVFMESHWQAVTRRLSEATARNVAALVELYEDYDKADDHRQLTTLARDRLNVLMQVLPPGELPPATQRPFFSLLDRTLSGEIRTKLGDRPFWIDTVGRSKHVEIKVQTPTGNLHFITRRSQTYASNSHIFLVWMVVTSIIVLTASILFLRNQIRPILSLAKAADDFGRGRATPLDQLRPRGAREVRRATEAFQEMQERITQHVDQRTTMLAGVSHDLRTVLTRFKLQLAFLEETPEVQGMRSDVRDMEHMLEDYLAFTRGDEGEEPAEADLIDLLGEIRDDAATLGREVELRVSKRRRTLPALIKRRALKRALMNLVSNAMRFGTTIVIRATRDRNGLRIDVEDNGPGVPVDERENVFKPFYRVDHARNQAKGNSGLGLAIARDVARSHGGDITLGASTLGGLKASIHLPA
ncbi:MAG: ATP-binding protein [Pseudomonadota bacterium]